MKNGLILVGIAFAVALAAVVGTRLSNDALAVVVGAVCGISASIPVTLGLAVAASRNPGVQEEPRCDYSASVQPQVVYVPPRQQLQPINIIVLSRVDYWRMVSERGLIPQATFESLHEFSGDT